MEMSSFSDSDEYLEFRGSVPLRKVPADPKNPEKVGEFRILFLHSTTI